MKQALIGTMLLVAGTAFAAAQAPQSDQGVARLSLVQGDVSTQRGANADWQAGAINAPMLTGDAVATAEGARAEVALDFADILRLDANSQATLANLSTHALQVQVGQGLVDYSVLGGAEAASELDTPNLAIHPKGRGIFRVQVNSDSETIVMVREGEADVSTSEGSATLHAGQMITVQGTDTPEYQIADAPGRDGFDDWNRQRDRSVENAQSWGRANRYYTGVNDLDDYGHWVFVPGYGQVWQPAVDAGWSPYSVGRWVWEPGWGWTWVSTEAWGWAPYHYGRWFYYQAGWVWWPGPVLVTPRFRPVWAPAYVAFLGFHAGGVSVGVGIGRVGWVPIGPADPFHPWWGESRGTRVAVTVVEPLAPVSVRVRYSNVERISTDPHIAAGVVLVSGSRFGNGTVVRERVNITEVRNVTVINGRVPVAHTAASVRVSDREVRTEALPRAAVERPTRFAGTPVATRPVPATRPGFQRFGGSQPGAAPRPVAPRPEVTRPGGTRPEASHPETTRPEAPRPQARPEHPAATPHANDPSWHRFNEAGRQGNSKQDKSGAKKKNDSRGGGGGGVYR
ncbi:MAG TPA: DUF6600 domain-containing protein [Terriglobales bacterium]|nr:DUF6600 domain-containing protein [Terriglobales bacterium]